MWLMRAFLRAVLDHPIRVLLALATLSAALGWSALQVGFSTDLQKMLPTQDASVQDYVTVSRQYGSQDYLLIAVQAEEGVFNARTLQKIQRITEALQALPDVWVEDVRSLLNAEVVEGSEAALTVRPAARAVPKSPAEVAALRETVLQERLLRRLLLNDDLTATLIIVEERVEIVDSDEEIAFVRAVEELLVPFQGPEAFRLSGGPYITSEVRVAMIEDLRALIPLAVLVLLGVLLFSFRQIRGTVLPLSVVLLSVLWTVGWMALVGFELTIVSVVIPVILIAIANADSIHILTRYQEVLHREPDPRRALETTLRALSRPVLYTSLTSAAGFLGLSTSYSVIIQQFGIAAAVGILFAMVISLTFLPAVLVLLAPRSAAHMGEGKGAWLARGGVQTVRGARLWMAGSLGVVALFLLGIPQLQINNNPLDYVRSDLPVVRSARWIEREFGGSLTLRVTLETGEPDRWKDPEWLRRVQAFQNHVEALEHVGVGSSLVDVVRELNVSLHGDDPAHDRVPDDIRVVAQELLLFEFGGGTGLDTLVSSNYASGQVTFTVASVSLQALRPLVVEIRDYVSEHFPEADSRITGPPMFGLRLGETLIASQVRSLLLSLLLVWIMLWILTRSLRLSAIGILPLASAVGITMGLMGYAGIALDLGTVMVASVSIGIGVDFAIHFIARYTQARTERAPAEAIHEAMASTGRALLYNTLSLGLGFSVMLGSKFTANIAFGALVGLTVLIAFVTTLRLIPALLLLSSAARRRPGPLS